MPPQVNAQLLTVDTQGSTDTFNAPADPNTHVFTGALDCYYEQKRDRRAGPGGSDVIVWHSLIVDDVVPIAFQEGQLVTWRWRGQDLSGVVQAVEVADAPLVPPQDRTTRLTMELQ